MAQVVDRETRADSPGWAELPGIVLAGLSSRVDRIPISEAAHTALYDSPEKPAGFGRSIDDPKLKKMTGEGTACSARPWR